MTSKIYPKIIISVAMLSALQFLAACGTTPDQELKSFYAAPTIKKINSDLSLTLSDGEKITWASVEMPKANDPNYAKAEKLLQGYLSQHVQIAPSPFAEGSLIRVMTHPEVEHFDAASRSTEQFPDLKFLNYVLVAEGLADYVPPAKDPGKDPDYAMLAEAEKLSQPN